MNTDDNKFVDFVECRCSSAIEKLEFYDKYYQFEKDYQTAKDEVFNLLSKSHENLLLNLFANLEEKHAIENAMYYKCGLIDGIETKSETL